MNDTIHWLAGLFDEWGMRLLALCLILAVVGLVLRSIGRPFTTRLSGMSFTGAFGTLLAFLVLAAMRCLSSR